MGVTSLIVWAACCAGGQEDLDRSLAGLAKRAQPGRLAVAALLPDGSLHGVHLDQPMPLQSVFKFLLGAAVLDAAVEGDLDLDERVELKESDLSVAWSPIAEGLAERHDYTIAELAEAAVCRSDNTAADWLLQRIGGPAILTRWLHDRGFRGIRLDRNERELQTESTGLDRVAPGYVSYERMKEQWSALPEARQRTAIQNYLSDERDTATPRDLVRVLTQLYDGELLDATSTSRLLKWMSQTTTGSRKISGCVPEGARFFHKTGRGADVLDTCLADNDVGIIETADGERTVIAVMLAGSTDTAEQRAKLIQSAATLVMTALTRPDERRP